MSVKKARLPRGVRLLSSGKYQARYPMTRDGVVCQVSAGTHSKIGDAQDAGVARSSRAGTKRSVNARPTTRA